MRLLSVSVFTALVCLALPSDTPAQHAPDGSANREARQIQLAPGLKLEVWAAEPDLLNPVAFSLAPTPSGSTDQPPGVAAYVAETHRYGISVLDITQNTAWLLNDLSLRSVADRTAFLSARFSTNLALLTRDSERVRLLADTNADHRADVSSVFADGFQSVADGTAAGVLVHGRDIWFGNIPNLWRLTPALPSNDPAPPPPARTSVAFGFGVHIGVTGHDLHGLTPGPDGRIYMSFGDRGLSITNREGVLIDLPDTGGVLRCEADGRNLEVYCTGLRNPQELAFDDYGNLFTSDNDTAGADDCRVLHLIRGADYGWRASYQHMKGFGPWVQEGLWQGDLDGVLPPMGKVSQGPAGLTHYPGTGFGTRFAGRFLHCDFPGGVWAFEVTRRGASFAVGPKEKIAWNCWPTDVEFGPDGALYLLDWVSGWGMPKKGRIYRISETSPGDALVSTQVHRLLADPPVSQSEGRLLEQLGHPDRRVRSAAQSELARRGRDSFPGLRRVAFTASGTLARLHALWAIGQIVRDIPAGSSQGDLSDSLAGLIRLLDDQDAEIRSHTALLLGESGLVNADLPIAALTQDELPQVRLRAAEAMTLLFGGGRGSLSLPQKATQWLEEKLPSIGRVVSQHVNTSLQFHPNGPVILDLVRSNLVRDPALRLAAASQWARLEKAEAEWPSYPGLSSFLANRIQDPSPEVRHTALLTLRKLHHPVIAKFLSDRDPHLVLEAARAIHDLPIPEALPALASHLRLTRNLAQPDSASTNAPARSFADQFTRRALNAHFRLGHATNALALAEFAGDDQPPSPAHLRAEALFLLGAWEITPASPGKVPVFPKPDPNHGAIPTVNPENWPGWFDRVVGLWRPLPPRSSTDARNALESRIAKLLHDPSPEVAEAAVDAAIQLRLNQAAAPLAALGPAIPISLRRRVPAALASLQAPETADAVRAALLDPDPSVRIAALPYLGFLGADSALPILDRLVANGLKSRDSNSLRLAQGALSALGRIPDSSGAAASLRPPLESMISGNLPPELELDLTDAVRQRQDSNLLQLLDQHRQSVPGADPLGPWLEVLSGGDSSRGRSLFFEKPETQCSRCHKIGAEGGTVGPPLDRLPSRLSRRQILDSILHPNAQITLGYENVLLTLRDGREVSGTVTVESPTQITLLAPEEGEVQLDPSLISSRRRTLSAMPEGLADLLNRHELRDIIEFLSTLR